MGASDDTNLLFGVFRLDLRGRRLLCREQDVPLRPKQFDVLRHLVQHHSRAVSINELLDVCWGKRGVGPNSVSNVIYSLRSVLAASGSPPEWIETVPRHGYRFSAPLHRPAPQPPQDLKSDNDQSAGSVAENDLFVGRDDELAWLQQRWVQVQRGVPAMVFVSGEPGIGKTTMVRRFCAAAGAVAHLCIGRCVPQQREAEPYMPVLEALSTLSSASGLAEIAREQAPTWLLQMPWLVASEERAAFGQLLEGVSSSRMLREGKHLFAALAQPAPLILLLEDVHWADPATVDLLRALAESEPGPRLMVIATYRPIEIVIRAHPLRELVGRLASHPRCGTVALGSLGPLDVRRYLERRFGSPTLAAELAPRLEEHSGGNPLFLDAMTTYLCEQQRIVLREHGWALATELSGGVVDLPDGLREMIRARLRQLAPSTLQTLEAAAVAGMDFSSLEVAAALDVTVAEVEKRCETLAEVHFVHAVTDVQWPDGSRGTSYRFGHAVYRDVLLGDFPRSRRRILHQRIVERLQAGLVVHAADIATRRARARRPAHRRHLR